MLLEYNFPEEVQRWVIGKKLPKDNDTLAKHGIKQDGNSVFLYCQSARTIGLSKARFRKQQQNMTGTGTGSFSSDSSMKHDKIKRKIPIIFLIIFLD